MRGLLVGTLALVALEVLTRSGAADRLGTGFAWANTGLQRLMSPDVALVPNRAGTATVKITK